MINDQLRTRQPDAITVLVAHPDHREAATTGANYDGATEHILRRLEAELDSRLCYHGVEHTRDSVLPAVENLAHFAGVDGEDLQLLRVAAAYHDAGFLISRADHEEASVKIAQETLQRFGFTQRQIATITGIIIATKLPQSPRNLLEQLMADADLDSLGRDDFAHWGNLLRAELAAFGHLMSDQEWHQLQLSFLQHHTYFSYAAKALREAKKHKNIIEIQRLLMT